MIMPPKTVVPTEWRPFSPAPLAVTRGTTPRMKAREVMRMGRRRMRGRLDSGFQNGSALFAQLLGELHDQNGVLR